MLAIHNFAKIGIKIKMFLIKTHRQMEMQNNHFTIDSLL